MSTFSGLEMGKRAMNYYRLGMQTAGHNIANADVEGYSRQRVEASTTDPFTDPGLNRPWLPGQIGTGVKVDAIVRLRDAFLDAQYIEESSVQGYWERIEQALEYVEVFVNEPLANENGGTLKTALDSFWSNLQELTKRPDSTAVRDALLEESRSLTVFLDQLATNYSQYRDSLNQDLEMKVREVNAAIDQIAALNVKIKEIKGVGGNPNDLLDRRDALVEKLSGLIDISVSSPAYDLDGDFKIDLNGKLLVQGDKTRHLVLAPVGGNSGYYDVQVEDNTFDYVDDPDILTVAFSQSTGEAVHDINVHRLATETAWKIGQAADPAAGLGRLKPTAQDEALGIRGSFSLQVGSSGVRATSSVQAGGILLTAPAGDDPTSYSFRAAWGESERIVDVTWNAGTSRWDISDNAGTTASSAGADLTVAELAGFLDGYAGLDAGSASDRLSLASTDNHLLSLTDIKGDLLGGKLKIDNDAPVVTIDVTEEDSLVTIRNKINGAYGSEGGPEGPEEWLVASIAEMADGTFSLVLESQVVGEAARINVLGDDQGSLYVAQRLGFVSGDGGGTAVLTEARDAVITVNNFTYLSSENNFSQARLLTSANGYRADVLQEVVPGMSFHLKNVGSASVTIRHAVRGGEIAGLMTARDDYLLGHMRNFDELAYTLALEMNAIHYSGHGTGDNAHVTGTAFFDRLPTRWGAAADLEVNALLFEDASLIAAAGGDGTGHSLGVGDGSNALRMAQLKQSPVLVNDSASFDEFYEAFLATLGTQGQRARTMATNQRELTGQIDAQRQSVMGVNIDEEMMDIIKFQQAFNAMARYITTIDETLDRIINGMGLVGR